MPVRKLALIDCEAHLRCTKLRNEGLAFDAGFEEPLSLAVK
jgi:hypothetical protein